MYFFQIKIIDRLSLNYLNLRCRIHTMPKCPWQARVYVLTLRGSHTVAGWNLCQMGAACMKLLGRKLWLILQIRAFLSQGWGNKSFSLTSCTSFRWSPSNCGQISCRYLRNACPCEMGHVTCLLVTLKAYLLSLMDTVYTIFSGICIL